MIKLFKAALYLWLVASITASFAASEDVCAEHKKWIDLIKTKENIPSIEDFNERLSFFEKEYPTLLYYKKECEKKIKSDREASAAEAAAQMSRAEARETQKVELMESKKISVAALSKELKNSPKSFEIRGFNVGGDYYQDIKFSDLISDEVGSDVEGYPDVRKHKTNDGGLLFFYRDLLFMSVYEDIQDTLELGAAMKKIESKLKGKFVKIPQEKNRDGNIETNTRGYRMLVGGDGTAEVKLSSSRPISRNRCIDDIASDMRMRITLGLNNYSSLTERVQNECVESLNPTQILFINKTIEKLVNARATALTLKNARDASDEKLRAANEKAKKF